MTPRPHDDDHESDTRNATEYWEARYADGRTRWSGSVNASLATEIAALPRGSALEHRAAWSRVGR